MSANTVEQRKNLGAADTDRGPSPNIWADCPVLDLLENPSKGTYFYDDFTKHPIVGAPTLTTEILIGGGYKAFASSGGTITVPAEGGGGVLLTETTDNEGYSLQLASLPFQIINTGVGKFWFEARLKCGSVTTLDGGILIGLGDLMAQSATVPIAAAGTMATTINFVGFQRLEATGTQFNTTYQANGVTQVVVKSSALTVPMVADTYIKFGMTYDPADRKMRWYINNLQLPDTKTVPAAAGTDFPNDVLMSPIIAALGGSAGGDLLTTLSWWRAAQLNV